MEIQKIIPRCIFYLNNGKRKVYVKKIYSKNAELTIKIRKFYLIYRFSGPYKNDTHRVCVKYNYSLNKYKLFFNYKKALLF
jgi:hypothetical protein